MSIISLLKHFSTIMLAIIRLDKLELSIFHFFLDLNIFFNNQFRKIVSISILFTKKQKYFQFKRGVKSSVWISIINFQSDCNSNFQWHYYSIVSKKWFFVCFRKLIELKNYWKYLLDFDFRFGVFVQVLFSFLTEISIIERNLFFKRWN